MKKTLEIPENKNKEIKEKINKKKELKALPAQKVEESLREWESKVSRQPLLFFKQKKEPDSKIFVTEVPTSKIKSNENSPFWQKWEKARKLFKVIKFYQKLRIKKPQGGFALVGKIRKYSIQMTDNERKTFPPHKVVWEISDGNGAYLGEKTGVKKLTTLTSHRGIASVIVRQTKATAGNNNIKVSIYEKTGRAFCSHEFRHSWLLPSDNLFYDKVRIYMPGGQEILAQNSTTYEISKYKKHWKDDDQYLDYIRDLKVTWEIDDSNSAYLGDKIGTKKIITTLSKCVRISQEKPDRGQNTITIKIYKKSGKIMAKRNYKTYMESTAVKNKHQRS